MSKRSRLRSPRSQLSSNNVNHSLTVPSSGGGQATKTTIWSGINTAVTRAAAPPTLSSGFQLVSGIACDITRAPPSWLKSPRRQHKLGRGNKRQQVSPWC
jgi:hypothetical protein